MNNKNETMTETNRQKEAPVPVLIPSYEPDERLITLLHELDEAGIGPVILVDDGSGPEYRHFFEQALPIIEKRGGTVLRHEVNKGKGRALKTGFSYVLKEIPEAIGVVTADSDGQHSKDCILAVSDALRKNPEALILGVRKFDTKNVPWSSRLGNKITETVFRFLSGVHITDTQTGLRGISRSFMQKLLETPGERFEFEMNMLMDAAGRLPIEEVTIKTIYDSKMNHQTHFNPFRDSFLIYRLLLKRFGRFVIASVSSGVLDFVLYVIFYHLLKPAFPNVYIALAAGLARILSAIYNYLMNRRFVFKSKEDTAKSGPKYFLLCVIQLCVSAGLTTLLVHSFGWNEGITKGCVDAVLFFCSYYIQLKLVFKKV